VVFKTSAIDHSLRRLRGRRPLARRGELASQHLEFELQPLEQEEDRQQAVIDQLMKRETQLMGARGDGDRRRLEVMVDARPRTIRRQERGACRGEE
jgi:hypothetical protein